MSAPVDPPEPTAPEPVEPTPQPGPWSADLATYFGENAEAIAAADRYMREKIQPRMTQLETETAPMRELYRDLMDNPDSTLQEVVAELYGEHRPDIVETFAGLFSEQPPAAPAAPEATPADAPPEWAKPLLERHENERERELREAGEAAYEEALTEMRTAHPDLTDADMELIHPFMASASGDTETAYAGFAAFKTAWAEANGAPAPPAEPAPTAPPVLGAEGTPAAAPPVKKEYKTFDDAWNAWRDEEAAAAPPVVGSV